VKLEGVDLGVGGEREEANDDGDEGEQHGWSSKDAALTLLLYTLVRHFSGRSPVAPGCA